MKHIEILLFLFLFPSGAFSQHEKLDESVLECRYKLVMQKDTVSKSNPEEDDMVLRIGKTASQYFSRHTFYHDSLWADPDGRKKAEDLSIESLYAFDKPKTFGPRTTRDFLYKNHPEGKMTTFTNDFIHVNFFYDENYVPQQWVVGNSTRQILGYTCQKAECDFRGRRWTVWFAPDIPISDGPWKFGGLPGLIMEAYDRGKQYYFIIVGLEQVEDEPILFSEPRSLKGKKFREINRRELLKAKMHQLTNGASIMEAESGILIGKDGPVYRDLIEKDYR